MYVSYAEALALVPTSLCVLGCGQTGIKKGPFSALRKAKSSYSRQKCSCKTQFILEEQISAKPGLLGLKHLVFEQLFWLWFLQNRTLLFTGAPEACKQSCIVGNSTFLKAPAKDLNSRALLWLTAVVQWAD